MGVEALAANLKPHFSVVHGDVVCGSLSGLGFERAAATLPGEVRFVLTAPGHVVEATARCGDKPADLVLLDLRIAVCHNPAALNHFFGVIQFLAQEHGLAVIDDRQVEYEPRMLPVWEESARTRYCELRANWVLLFDGDSEERALTPGDAWRYFLAKRPGATRTITVLE